MNHVSIAALAVALLLACSQGEALQPGAVYGTTRPSADGIGKTYQGREISQVMGWEGADWLDRVDRVKEERPDLLLEALALQPGMTVADVGAGTGYTTWQMAARVGESGKVYAV